jgi:hypothetical protein
MSKMDSPKPFMTTTLRPPSTLHLHTYSYPLVHANKPCAMPTEAASLATTSPALPTFPAVSRKALLELSPRTTWSLSDDIVDLHGSNSSTSRIVAILILAVVVIAAAVVMVSISPGSVRWHERWFGTIGPRIVRSTHRVSVRDLMAAHHESEEYRLSLSQSRIEPRYLGRQHPPP